MLVLALIVVLFASALEPLATTTVLLASPLPAAISGSKSLLRFPLPPVFRFLAALSGAIPRPGVIRDEPAIAILQQAQP